MAVPKKEMRWLVDEKYGGKRTAAAEKDIARLEKGEHVDYIIGWVDFLDCKIDLRYRPLIPRPETEYWVHIAIHEALDKAAFENRPSRAPAACGVCALDGLPSLGSGPGQTISESFSLAALSRAPIRMLDMFSGSGCVGIAVLKHVPNAFMDFAEKDKKLFNQIEISATLNDIDKNRYKILQSDVFSHITGKYDFILANPPYVAESRREKVQKSVLEQESKEAVFGGPDGLQYIQKFLGEVKKYLRPGGVVYLEFDSQQKARIEKLAKHAGAASITIHKDQYHKWRYARIIF